MKTEQNQKIADTLLNSPEEDYFKGRRYISGKDIQNFLNSRKGKSKVKSVTAPSAPYTKKFKNGNNLKFSYAEILRKINQFKDYDINLYLISHILLASGCRISEVLAIHSYDILEDLSIKIKGLKGSNDRIIYVPTLSAELELLKKRHVYIFENYNRFYVYREFKKIGLYQRFENNNMLSVTHLFRHMKIRNLKNENMKISDIANYIGHKNEKNTEKY